MLEGHREYRRREFCNDIQCPVQIELNKQEQGSEKYGDLRMKCKTGCIKSTYEFHHWLIGQEFLIIKKE